MLLQRAETVSRSSKSVSTVRSVKIKSKKSTQTRSKIQNVKNTCLVKHVNYDIHNFEATKNLKRNRSVTEKYSRLESELKRKISEHNQMVSDYNSKRLEYT